MKGIIEILTELDVNERSLTKLAQTELYATDRDRREKLFITISADEIRGTIPIYFTVHIFIGDQQY